MKGNFGVQDLFCVNDYIFLVEYHYQTSILTAKNTSLKINNKKTYSKILVYPNPAKEKLFISFYCEQNSYTEINIYDISGKKVKTVFSGNLRKGKHIFVWDVLNDTDKKIPETYFCKVKTQNHQSTKKIIIQ